MPRRPLASTAVLLIVTLLVIFPCLLPRPALAQEANPHRSLLAHADALVTVKFVLKLKMAGGGDEFDGEVTCQLIDAEGLVLCSNTELGGYVTLVSRISGRGGNVSAVPAEIEVLLGDSTEGLKARLLTRDTDRDLAWIRIEEMPETAPLPYLDFSQNAEVEIGDKLYSLRRLNKFFGSEPVVSEGVLIAKLRKPRRLLLPSNPKSPGFGVPVFTADGRLVGITVLQLPGVEDDAARIFGNPTARLGTSVGLQDMIGGLILPASEVVKATELAREISAADEAEEMEAEESE